MSYITVDAELVKRQIFELRSQFPELDEDESFALDVYEGQTDLFRILSKIVAERSESETMVSAIKERVSDLNTRSDRFKRRSDFMKKLAKGLMDAAHQPKITLPEATLSVLKPRTSVNVIDADQLPQGFFSIVRQPDKKAIGEALLAGEQIPGAELALGDEGLMIKVK
jgi:hypothetical protein